MQYLTSKTIGLTALIGAAALVLAGCSGSGAGGAGGDEGPTPEEGGTIVYASWEWAEPGRGELIWDALQAYAEENPNVTLEQQTITRADYDKTISTQIGAGGGPDLMIIPDPFLPTLVAGNALVPLNDVVEGADLRPINEDYVFDGDQLAVIWETSNYALFWNQSLLDAAGVQPPETFDELLEAASAVEAATGATGFAVRHQMNEETAWWTDFSNWPVGFGGGWSDGEELTINSPENVEAVEALKAMYDSGAFAVGDDASTYRSKFGAGDIAFLIDNSNIPASILANGSITSDQIGSSALPFPTEDSVHVGNLIGVNANSENVAIAKDFIRWMLTEPAQQSLASALFPASPGTEVAADEELVAANPWFESFYAQGENSRSAIVGGFETQTQAIASIVLNQVSRVLTAGVPAQEALDTAQEEASSLVG